MLGRIIGTTPSPALRAPSPPMGARELTVIYSFPLFWGAGESICLVQSSSATGMRNGGGALRAAIHHAAKKVAAEDSASHFQHIFVNV